MPVRNLKSSINFQQEEAPASYCACRRFAPSPWCHRCPLFPKLCFKQLAEKTAILTYLVYNFKLLTCCHMWRGNKHVIIWQLLPFFLQCNVRSLILLKPGLLLGFECPCQLIGGLVGLPLWHRLEYLYRHLIDDQVMQYMKSWSLDNKTYRLWWSHELFSLKLCVINLKREGQP